MKIIPYILLSVASVLSVRCPAQVVIQPPGIRAVLAGPGITVNTNGFTRTISAPGAAGDITGGAVTGGLLTVSEGAGILTYGLTTNSVVGALALQTIRPSVISPASGALSITGPAGVTIAAGGGNDVTIESATIIDGNLDVYNALTVAGNTALTTASNLNLANATNTLDRARLPTTQTTPHISWASSDCTFHSTQGIWWSPYENTAIDFGAFGLRAAAADDQLGTLRTKWLRRPPEAATYHETASIVLTFAVSSTAGVTECRGLRLMGRDLKTDTPTTIYTDSSTRDGHASSAGSLVTFVIARSSLSTTALYNDYQAEVDISAEDGETWALESVEVRFQ